MRYDTPVTFVKETERKRLPSGNYTTGKEYAFDGFAHVSAISHETEERIYGEVKNGTRAVRMLNEPEYSFDHIYIDAQPYMVDDVSRFKNKVAYTVSEVG